MMRIRVVRIRGWLCRVEFIQVTLRNGVVDRGREGSAEMAQGALAGESWELPIFSRRLEQA